MSHTNWSIDRDGLPEEQSECRTCDEPWPCEVARLRRQNDDLLAALEEIAKGEGAFSRDPLGHATAVIDNMLTIAEDAIRAAKGAE